MGATGKTDVPWLWRSWRFYGERDENVIYFADEAHGEALPPPMFAVWPKEHHCERLVDDPALGPENLAEVDHFLGDVAFVVSRDLLPEDPQELRRCVYRSRDLDRVLIASRGRWKVRAKHWKFAILEHPARDLGQDRVTGLRGLLSEILARPPVKPTGEPLEAIDVKVFPPPHRTVFAKFLPPGGEGFCGGRFEELWAASDGAATVLYLKPAIWDPRGQPPVPA